MGKWNARDSSYNWFYPIACCKVLLLRSIISPASDIHTDCFCLVAVKQRLASSEGLSRKISLWSRDIDKTLPYTMNHRPALPPSCCGSKCMQYARLNSGMFVFYYFL